jgi:hypothetical protein
MVATLHGETIMRCVVRLALMVLLNTNGSPLWTERMSKDGKYQKTDNVKNAFDRLRKTLGITKPLKSLKKRSDEVLLT